MRAQQNNPRALWSHVQLRKKNICFHGAILCFYIIAAITTFIYGIYGLSVMKNTNDDNKSDDDDDNDSKMNFNIFTYTLPFVSFILDHSTKRIKNLNEKNFYIMCKLILIIYYLGAYVLALQQTSTTEYYVISNVNFIVFPIITAVYGRLLRKNKLA
jgi:hypothetical protein